MRNCYITSTNALIGLWLITPFSSVAGTEPSVQLLGGVEISRDASYAYAGRVTPLPGSQLGNGIVSRLWVDWSTYKYEKNNVSYDASVPGVEIALGYQHAKADYWWSAFGGVIYHYTSISPHDPESAAQGGKFRTKLQVEGEQKINQLWKLSGNASYIFGQEAYWTRARLFRSIGSGHRLGLEAIIQGDPDYRLTQVGVVLFGIKLSDEISTGVKIGVRKAEGLNSQAYMGVELENRF